MASLNWALLSPTTHEPIPLPREKILLTLPHVSLDLNSHQSTTSTSTSATSSKVHKVEKGTVYCSNIRVIYVVPPSTSSSSTATSIPTSGELESLSIPYTDLLDGRIVQPWFTANYYEGMCRHAHEGGLSGPQIIKLYFKEGGAFDFYSTVLEMKERIGNVSSANSSEAVAEDLPLYTPNASSSSSSSTQQPSSSSSHPTVPLPPTSTSDLEIASIARQAQEVDDARDEERRNSEVVATSRRPPPAPTTGSIVPPPIGNDAPPGYDEA